MTASPRCDDGLGVYRVMPNPSADVATTFSEHLTRFAETASIPQLSPIIARLTRRVGVAVVGRAGVGRDTVAAALRDHGVAVTADTAAADVQVLVIAEALKPEERAMAATDRPTLIVLNKADLTGSRSGGALPNAHRTAADVQRRTGTPTVAMVGLLGKTTALDDDLVDALRTLVHTAADLRSVDAFTSGDHPVGREIRTRLLERLDRFGIAHAVLALARGADPATLPTLLQRLSNVDAVLARLDASSAPVRYRRLRAALAEMHSLAVQLDDQALLGLLNSDAAVLATMTAAVDVVEADGIRVDPGDDPDAHRRRAAQWRRYSRGPVDSLHRRCGADITRGSLRLLDGFW
ncbi:MAG: hypothetical protein QOH54_3154 [Mycobacterium sp.]|nr:hypothetical protein [Mycobacterium sp.]